MSTIFPFPLISSKQPHRRSDDMRKTNENFINLTFFINYSLEVAYIPAKSFQTAPFANCTVLI